MAYCTKCGVELVDGAKFCFECGEPLTHKARSFTLERKSVYDGEIHKCPNCGELLASFQSNCPTCGHELRGEVGSSSVRAFAAKLEEIEQSRPIQSNEKKRNQLNQEEIDITDQKKISLIRSYTIPNTKEDYFEFLVLSATNINLRRHNSYESTSKSEAAVSDAWEAKFEQAYAKAKLAFGHTADFERMQSLYDKTRNQIEMSKKRGKTSLVIMFTCLAVLLIFAFGMTFATNAGYQSKIDAEHERLDAIVEEVYEAIDDENYMLARAKAASLAFSGPAGIDCTQDIEKWDKTRTELLRVIDLAESGEEIGATINQDE